MLEKLELNNMKWRISLKLIFPFQIDDLRSIIGMSEREITLLYLCVLFRYFNKYSQIIQMQKQNCRVPELGVPKIYD
jgi:hypothetical protein